MRTNVGLTTTQRLGKGEGEAKGGTVTRLTRHLHLPALHLHHRPGDHQAKASATDRLCRGVVRPVEASEELGLLLCGQSDAAIGYRYPGNWSDSLDREVDVSFLRGIFVRIGEQIAEDLHHPLGVTEHHGGFLRQMQGEFLPLGIPAWLKGWYQFVNEEVDIEGFAVQFHLAGLHA